MFVQTGDFVNQAGMAANDVLTFYGQEKTSYNANLCRMNMAVHNLNGQIVSGEDANTYYHDHYHLAGRCDYVMAILWTGFPMGLVSLPCISSQITNRIAC